ncbi:MAG: hypothetical protein ACXWJN_05425, partial [Methyloceanibacter sp.]
HYKRMRQETMAEGMKIVVDGHVIAATPGELSIDGKPQSFEPDQDVQITINEKGAVEVKPASSDGAGPEAPVN